MDEVGITVDPVRFEVVGSPGQFETHLTIASFFAFSPDEEDRLSAVAEDFVRRYGLGNDIRARYNPRARSLEVFAVKPSTGIDTFRAVADDIRTG